jgi:hypothetical protein
MSKLKIAAGLAIALAYIYRETIEFAVGMVLLFAGIGGIVWLCIK